MTIQEIQRLRSAQPFEPFRVLTADGEEYDVGHPEYLGQTPSGRLITIGLEDDSTVTLDLLLVTGIVKQHRRAKRRRAPLFSKVNLGRASCRSVDAVGSGWPGGPGRFGGP